MNLPASLDFGKVAEHVSAITGDDRYEILRQLGAYVEAGALHPTGRLWQSTGGLAPIPPMAWVCYQLLLDSRDPSECIAYRRNDDRVRCPGPMVAFTAIRFLREEILQLWSAPANAVLAVTEANDTVEVTAIVKRLRSSPKQDAIFQVYKDLWPEGAPTSMSAQERNGQISAELNKRDKENFPLPGSPGELDSRKTAIGRALKSGH